MLRMFFGSRVVVAEKSHDRPDRADFTCPDKIKGAIPLRMSTNHKRLLDLYARTITGFQQRYGFLNCETDRLFAEDMFSSFCSLDRPWDVEVIRQWNINGLDTLDRLTFPHMIRTPYESLVAQRFVEPW